MGPSRHLVRRSDLVANGARADVRTRARNDAVDPKATLTRPRNKARRRSGFANFSSGGETGLMIGSKDALTIGAFASLALNEKLFAGSGYSIPNSA